MIPGDSRDRQHEHDVELEPVNPADSPSVLAAVLQRLRRYVPGLVDAGERFLQARAGQESAKALEIKARVYRELESLELERQRLIEQRESRKAQDAPVG